VAREIVVHVSELTREALEMLGLPVRFFYGEPRLTREASHDEFLPLAICFFVFTTTTALLMRIQDEVSTGRSAVQAYS